MTRKSKGKHLAFLAFLLSAALATAAPREARHAVKGGQSLATLPARIGDWTMRSGDQAASAKEAGFLNQVVFRTYERKDGKRVVLVVAYGADQRKKYNLHMPEVCFKASGYQVISQAESSMHAPELMLRQLVVSAGPSDTEPVQYWFILDGKQVTSELEKRIRHLYYSMVGADADGVLVRVSSVASEAPEKEYQVQKDFIGALYRSVDPQLRKVLFGKS